MKKILCALLFCLSCSVWGQVQVSEELKYLEKLQEAFQVNKETEIVPTPRASLVKQGDELQPVYQAVLKKGSKVRKPKEDESWRVEKPIYVKARLQFPGSPYAFLLNKEGESILATRTENLSSLEQITQLYPQNDPTKTYEDATQFRASNTNQELEAKLSVHFESSDASYLSQFHSSSDTTASSTRMQVESYFLSFLPLDFGLSLSYQAGSFGDEQAGQRTSFNASYFGPVIKTQVFQKEDSILEVFAKAEKSLTLNSDDGVTQNQFSSNVWSFGADWTKQTFLGRFFAGVAYRIQHFSLKETSAPSLQIPSEKESLTGPSVYLGFRFTINL